MGTSCPKHMFWPYRSTSAEVSSAIGLLAMRPPWDGMPLFRRPTSRKEGLAAGRPSSPNKHAAPCGSRFPSSFRACYMGDVPLPTSTLLVALLWSPTTGVRVSQFQPSLALAAPGQFVKGCGRPFIIAGDWQVNPAILAETKFPHRLAADIVSADGPTNLRAGSTLDYFVVARSIRVAVKSVETRADLYLSPHVLVMLSLATRSSLGFTMAMSQPKVFPVGHLGGPMPPCAGVDWSAVKGADLDIDTRLKQWFAGAEFELMGVLGVQGSGEECDFLGLGTHGHMVRRKAVGRYPGSPDQLGLVGQRLSWAMRSAKAVASVGASLLAVSSRGPRFSPSL